MGSPNEPPRKIDLKKWDATWERIRANQAKQRAEAAAAELRAGIDIQLEDLSPEHIVNLHDAAASASGPTVPEHLPPLPPFTQYAGVVRGLTADVRAFYHHPPEGDYWIGPVDLCAYDGPPGSSGDWHVAIPIDEQS